MPGSCAVAGARQADQDPRTDRRGCRGGDAWEDKPYTIIDGKVDFGTYNGYRRYEAYCLALPRPGWRRQLLRARPGRFAQDAQLRGVHRGRGVRQEERQHQPAVGHAGLRRGEDVMENIDDIYSYLKARADGALAAAGPSACRSSGAASSMLGIERLAAACRAVALICGATSGFAQIGELVDRNMLRVCADPAQPAVLERGRRRVREQDRASCSPRSSACEIAYTWYPQIDRLRAQHPGRATPATS